MKNFKTIKKLFLIITLITIISLLFVSNSFAGHAGYADLKEALEKVPVYTISKDQKLSMATVIQNNGVKHTGSCVQVLAANCTVGDSTIISLTADSSGYAEITRIKPGSSTFTMNVSTSDCSEYGTTSVVATVTILVVPNAKDFMKEYLKGDGTNLGGDNLIVNVEDLTTEELFKILESELTWTKMNDSDKIIVNNALTTEGPITYLELLQEVKDKIADITNEFIKDYISDKDDNIYPEATSENYEKILLGETIWNEFSDKQKELINNKLLVEGSKEYPELIEEAIIILENKWESDNSDLIELKVLTKDDVDNIKKTISDYDKLPDTLKVRFKDKYNHLQEILKAYEELQKDVTPKTGIENYTVITFALTIISSLAIITIKKH